MYMLYVCAHLYMHMKILDDNLAELTNQFEQATAAKLKCQQEAEATATTISLANRYIVSLYWAHWNNHHPYTNLAPRVSLSP